MSLDWLSPSAKDKCDWRCAACGHTWVSSVASRARMGTGCPVCSRVRTDAASRARSLPGVGESLADLHPQVAAEFLHCDRDPTRTPSSLRPQSNLCCTWRCSRCEHEYSASPAGRVRGRGCATCGRERTRRARATAAPGAALRDLHPAIAAELLECLDGAGLTAAQLHPRSNKRCRWRCPACGHTWDALVATRTAGNGCPDCGRRRSGASRATAPRGLALADMFPALAAEFVANETNAARTPVTLKPGSHDRCRWRCVTCTGEWVTALKNRTRNGTGCPHCHRTAKAR
ncbi:zinc-ribbon domain-containing protein [Geodermatophilus poikilotrophus]|uniref:zinc-ribbon domain-containing protein n=1 Tax=Geodermatophilus poikilotrophus TaxID=1333667 RepID=UPI003CCB9BA9